MGNVDVIMNELAECLNIPFHAEKIVGIDLLYGSAKAAIDRIDKYQICVLKESFWVVDQFVGGEDGPPLGCGEKAARTHGED